MESGNEYLRDVIADVLSSMCFAAPEFVGPGQIPLAITSSIEFSGDIQGELRLAVNEQLARQLAADFVGIEPSLVTAESARSFALELANVLCGAALASAASKKNYSVSLPSVLESEGPDVYPYCFSVNGEAADIGLALRLQEASEERRDGSLTAV